jgi:hypothetical protein
VKSLQTSGYSAVIQILQVREAASRWMHCTNAGFPCGMPVMWEEMEGITQQAPQSVLQSITHPFGTQG